MFTGLVENVGTIAEVSNAGGAESLRNKQPRRLRIATTLAGAEDAESESASQGARSMRLGDSVAIDGCCLTIVHIEAGHLSFEAATETLARTTLGSLEVGAQVHLERALCFGDRLGGHLVSGHIDAVGTLVGREMRGSALYLDIEAPDAVARLTAARGSITIAGVSLTVTDVSSNTISVGLIPHTLTQTTLGALSVGDKVNLEADLIARYVERLLGHASSKEPAQTISQPVHSPKVAPRLNDGV